MIVVFVFIFHLDEICQACVVLSPIKMVPETQLWQLEKAFKSKHRETHKGIKDQNSDSSESTLGDIRQRDIKELEYKEQRLMQLSSFLTSHLPPHSHLILSMFTLKNEMKRSIVLLSGGRVFKVWCEMNCRWIFWLGPFSLLLVLDNLVLVNHEIAAGEHIY